MPRTHWYPAYVGIGSNLDEPQRQVETTFPRLAGLPGTRLIARSSLYQSPPFGGIEQPDFVNAVAALLTTLAPGELLGELQALEQQAGRTRNGPRWGPRVLDLDLLVYAGWRFDEPGLVVPHPGIAERNFVLLPLGEIAPQLVIPGLGPVSGIPIDASESSISRISRS